MTLSLKDVRRIAQDVVTERNANLKVVGVSKSEGGSYIEVVVIDAKCTDEPCRLVIGGDRRKSESAFRTAMQVQLQDQLERRDRASRRLKQRRRHETVPSGR
jgi:hypothetical protein